MSGPIVLKNFKNLIAIVVIVFLGLVPLSIFGLFILLGLLFKVISLAFN